MEVFHLKGVMVVTGVSSNGTTVQGYDLLQLLDFALTGVFSNGATVQGYDFVRTAGLRALVSICPQGNSNRTGSSRFAGVPNP